MDDTGSLVQHRLWASGWPSSQRDEVYDRLARRACLLSTFENGDYASLIPLSRKERLASPRIATCPDSHTSVLSKMASPIASSSAQQHDGAMTSFQVAFRGQNHALRMSTSRSVGELQEEIAELTHVDVTRQKLLGSGPHRSVLSKAREWNESSLKQAGLVSKALERPIKVMVVGPTSGEVDAVEKGDKEAEKRNRPRQFHPSMLRGAKVRLFRDRVCGGEGELSTLAERPPFPSLEAQRLPLHSPRSTLSRCMQSHTHHRQSTARCWKGYAGSARIQPSSTFANSTASKWGNSRSCSLTSIPTCSA